MTCALSPEQIKDLYKVVLKYLSDARDQDKDFSLNEISNLVYNAVFNATKDPVRAIAYVQLIPSTFAHAAFASDLFDFMESKEFNLTDVLSKSREFSKDPDNVVDFLGLEKSNEDTIEALEKSEKEKKIEEEEAKGGKRNKKPLTEEEINRRARNPMKVNNRQEAKNLQGNRTEVEEEKVNFTEVLTEQDARVRFNYELTRKIVEATFSQDSRDDSGGLLYTDSKGTTTALFMSIRRDNILPKEYLMPSTKEALDKDPKDRDEKENTIVSVYEKSGVVAVITDIEGNIILFDENFNVVEKNGVPYTGIIPSVSQLEKDENAGVYKNEFLENAKVVKKIRKYLQSEEGAKDVLVFTIGESSMGQFQATGESKLEDLKNIGVEVQEKIEYLNDNLKLFGDGTDNRLILSFNGLTIESNYLHFGDTDETRKLAEVVAQLALNKDLKGKRGEELTYIKRKEIIETFYRHGAKDPFRIIFNDEKETIEVISGTDTNVTNWEDLYKLLTENFPDQNYSKQMRIDRELIDNPTNFKDYSISNSRLKIDNLSYIRFLYNNVTWKFTYLDNGYLRLMNSYFTYELTDEVASKLDVDKSKLGVGIPKPFTRDLENTKVVIVENTQLTKKYARNNSESVVYSMRPNEGDNIPGVNENQNFGNPWTSRPSLARRYGLLLAEGETEEEMLKNAVSNYESWLKGEKFEEVEPERRAWILREIDRGFLDGKELAYFKSGYRSHADVLVEFVKDRRAASLQTEETETEIKETKVNVPAVNKSGTKTSQKPASQKSIGLSIEEITVGPNKFFIIRNAEGKQIVELEFRKKELAVRYIENTLSKKGYVYLEDSKTGEVTPATEEQKVEIADNATLNPPGVSNPNDEVSEEPAKKPGKGRRRTRGIDTDALERAKTLDRDVSQTAIDDALAWWNSDSNKALRAQAPLNLMFNLVNSNAWAVWTAAATVLKDGTSVERGITLFEGSNYTDIYHEAWHVFSQLFLSRKDKIRLYKSIRKQPGTFKTADGRVVEFKNAEFFDIEEYLAEDYRNYSIRQSVNKGQPVRNSIFRRIFNFIKSLFTGPTKDVLFEKLYFGKINNYTPNINNMMFNKLNSIKPVDKNPLNQNNLNDTEQLMLLGLLESISSDSISNAIKRGTSINRFLGSVKNRRIVFDGVKSEFEGLIKDLKEEISQTEDLNEIKIKEDQIRIIDFGLRNFGNIEEFANDRPAGGLLDFYRKSKEYIDVEIQTEEEDADNADPSNANPDKAYGIENKSIKDSIDVDLKGLLQLVRAINPEITPDNVVVNEDGRVVDTEDNFYKLNSFGFPESAEYTSLVRVLHQFLGGKEQSYEAVIKVLEDNLKVQPVFQQIIDLLPTAEQQLNDTNALNIVTNFILAFTRPVIPNIVTTVNKQRTNNETEEGGKSEPSKENVVSISRLASASSTVKRNWVSDFKFSQAYLKKDENTGDEYLDIERVIKEFDKIDGKNRYAFLRALGITLSPQSQYLIEGEIDKTKGKIFENLATIHKQIEYLHKGLKALNENRSPAKKADKLKFLSEPIKYISDFDQLSSLSRTTNVGKLSQSTLITRLAEIEVGVSGKYNSGAALNANGDLVFDSTFFSSVSFIINAVNNSPTLDALYAKYPSLNPANNPLLEYNVFINSLYEDGNRISKNKIELESLAGLSESINGSYTVDGKTETDLSSSEKFIAEINTFLSRGKIEVPRHSSKNTALALSTKAFKIVSSDSIIESFIDRLESELKRIDLYESEKKSEDSISKPAYDKLVHAYFDSGKSIKRPAGSTLNFFNDMLEDETKKKIYEHIKAGNSAVSALDKYIDLIKTDLNKYFGKVSRETYQRYEKIKKLFLDENGNEVQLLNKEILSKYGGALGNAITDYTLNSILLRFDVINLIHGDIAQFNMAKENYSKYNAGVATAGNSWRLDSIMVESINKGEGGARPFSRKAGVEYNYDGQTLNTAVAEDFQVGSMFSNDIKENVINYYKEFFKLNDKDAKALYEKEFGDEYDNMTVNDGQAVITFDAYRILKKSQNKWSDEQESIYRDILNDRFVDPADIRKYFPVLKLQHYGNLKIEGLPVTAYHKFSLMPLIPGLIEGTPYERINREMIAQQIDYLNVDSGSKINNLGAPTKIYKDLKSNSSELEDKIDFVKNPIHIEFLKEVTNSSDKFKFDITFSTQMRKLIEDNLYVNGKVVSAEARKAIESYEKNIRFLTETLKYEFLKEIGWEQNDDGTFSAINGDKTKLSRYLISELSRKNYPKWIIEKIKVDKKGEFINDLSFLNIASNIETIIASAVSRRITKQKVYGQQAVMVSSANFGGMVKFKEATLEDIQKWLPENVVLPYYTKVNGNIKGKTRPMGVAISLSGDFLNLLKLKHNDGEVIGTRERLNEMIINEEWLNAEPNRRKSLLLAGARIPVQGLNSMEFAQVYHFLPTEAGSIIIPPAEIVIKSGADFDFDKLPTLLPKIDSDGNWVELSEYESLDDLNKAIDNYIVEKRQDSDIKDLRVSINDLKKAFSSKSKDISEKISLVYKMLSEANNAREKYKQNMREILDQIVEDGEDLPAELIGYSTMDDKAFIAAVNSMAIEPYEYKGQPTFRYVSPDNNSDLNKFSTQLADEFDKYHNQRKPLDTAIKEMEEIKAAYPEFKNEFDAAVDEFKNKVSEYEKGISELKKKRKNFKYGIMNALIQDMHNILSLPENYLSLVKPNATGLVKGVADDLKEALSKQPGFQTTKFSKMNNKEEDYVSGTRVLEPVYNIDKFNQFLVSKKGLGIAAIENTFNILFNSLGAETPESYVITNSKNIPTELPYRILMSHNKNRDGRGIDLSQIYSKGTNTKIGDLLSQLINGFVDAEKDPWIFYLQANLQTTPILLYLIKAGVPFSDAAYFVSNPYIREYIELKQSKNSLFIDQDARDNVQFTARKTILSKYKDVLGKDIPASTSEILKLATTFESDFDSQELKDIVNGVEGTQKRAVEGLLHFFELEEQASKQTAIKMATNFDTTKDNTIFAARNRKDAIDILKTDPSYKEGFIDMLVNDSVISSFYLSEFVSALGFSVQSFRQNTIVSDFLLGKAKLRNFNEQIKQTAFPKLESFINEFNNDIVLAIFQTSINTFKPGYSSEYKDNSTKKSLPVEYKRYIPGTKAIVKEVNGEIKLLFDADGVRQMYDQSKKDSGEKLKEVFGDNVNFSIFPDIVTFENFVAERAFVRYFNPNLSKEEVNDKALRAIMNVQYLFKDKNTAFALKFVEMINNAPDILKSYFSVLGQIHSDTISIKNSKGRIYKLRFQDKGIDKNSSQDYYEQLKSLSNYEQLQSIVEPKTEEEKKQLKDLAEAFAFLPNYIFYQTGISNTRNNWTKVLDTSAAEDLVKQKIQSGQVKLDEVNLEKFYRAFRFKNSKTAFKEQIKVYDVDYFNINPVGEYIEGSLQSASDETTQFMLDKSTYIFDMSEDVSIEVNSHHSVIYVLPISYNQYETGITLQKYRNMKFKNYSYVITGYRTINDGFKEMPAEQESKVKDAAEKLLNNLIAYRDANTPLAFSKQPYMDVEIGGAENMPKYKDILLMTNTILYRNFGYLNNGIEQLESFRDLVQNAEGITQQDIDNLENTCNV